MKDKKEIEESRRQLEMRNVPVGYVLGLAYTEELIEELKKRKGIATMERVSGLLMDFQVKAVLLIPKEPGQTAKKQQGDLKNESG